MAREESYFAATTGGPLWPQNPPQICRAAWQEDVDLCQKMPLLIVFHLKKTWQYPTFIDVFLPRQPDRTPHFHGGSSGSFLILEVESTLCWAGPPCHLVWPIRGYRDAVALVEARCLPSLVFSCRYCTPSCQLSDPLTFHLCHDLVVQESSYCDSVVKLEVSRPARDGTGQRHEKTQGV